MVLIIRKIFSFILLFSYLLLRPESAYADGEPSISAQSAIVMHGDTAVYAKSADDRLPIASTTKLMTGILAIENCDLNESVTAKAQWCGIEGSSMYLTQDQSYLIRDLLAGLLLESGNDAAVALAELVSGSVSEFVALMNKKAGELGMTDTHFSNPSGLPADDHYSTARDLAKLAVYCARDDCFRNISGTKSIEINGLTCVNHNKLLEICDGCFAGKTGYTRAAGRCLVSCCSRDGTEFVCVTLNAPNDWDDHCALYDWAFEHFSELDLTEGISYTLPVISGEISSVELVPRDKIKWFGEGTPTAEVSVQLPFFLFAPIKKGSAAGALTVTVNGEPVGTTELVCTEDVPLELDLK